MTVYVDDMRMRARVGRIDARWSHLTADTDEELHAFAAEIGLQRRWAQFPGSWKSHYVTDGVRARAIAHGAVEIGYGSRESVALMRRKRVVPAAAQLVLPLNGSIPGEDGSSSGGRDE